jgi:hypothetical protein
MAFLTMELWAGTLEHVWVTAGTKDLHPRRIRRETWPARGRPWSRSCSLDVPSAATPGDGARGRAERPLTLDVLEPLTE